MEGQTLLTRYLSISPSPSPSSSAPSTPHNMVIEIMDESEDGDPPIPVSSGNEIPLVCICEEPSSTESLGCTRQRTANMIACAATRSDDSDADSETDSEVDMLIRGDEMSPPKMQEHADWSILQDQIVKLLKKQRGRVTMQLSEVC